MGKHRRVFGAVAATAILVAAVAGAMLGGGLGATAAEAATTAGCGKAPTLRSGTYSIQSGGQNRSYVLRVPDNYDSNHPYRLIFGLHWLNGSAANVSSNGWYGLVPRSNNSAIFVAPQGIDNGWANSGGRDLTLVDDIMRLVESDLCVETTQRFALGWSYGGAMSYALACARPTVFRAVAVYSGANLSGCSGGTQPVAYFGIHGIYDSVLNISAGRSLRDTFVRNNGCTAQSPREPARGSGTHITTVYSGCRSGYPVQWAAFDGDHTPSPVDGSGPNDSTTWTSGEVWSFFAQFQGTTPTSAPTTTPPTGQACTASYKLVGQWQGGFQAEVTVTAGSSGLRGWRVGWTFANGQAITQIWGGRSTPSGSTQNVSNETYNGNLNPGASTTFGFLGSWNGTNGSPTLACAQE